ncbi:zygotic DNA replication licensing factor mcm3 [Schistocerca serialis cubense]|uniref:zygotic DNA replication licensing factor mcm3 n=1 Tax=Schistocerca cancellata TaxID=274614 RepID=UPI002118BA72|nr:zygotic DNA replication licensing factor mcm3 [Schistocerca cancellata]XP_049962071.1 zygotic DNA replication licensing factor mcm3 [Schistocerca serialis cubense]
MAMEEADVDQRLRGYQREYLDFLDDEEDQGRYSKLVKDMVADKRRRLVVNINDLRRKNPLRAASLLNNPFEEQIAFQAALKEYVGSIDPTYAKEVDDFFVAFEGSFGSKHVTPRTLLSRFLGNLVCVEGIVTKCSLVRPKVVRSVHYCPVTKKTLERRYTDLTSFDAFPSSAVYPTKDEDGNPLETEYGLSVYKDHQTLTIQEMPEKAPAGQLPRSVDVICDNDLVDICKPGDRVQIVGNYRCLPSKQGGFSNCTFRTILIANNISPLSKENTLALSRGDVAKCRKLVNAKSTGDIFELLSKSLAPSIHGHEYIKKAILCMLLGGVEKVLPNGTRLRGDINVLLIGDPSVAKSQLLRYVLATAPRAIPTTGRGSTGVGLTAAVTTDQETGERRLEAGAMVLADRGVVCIDEFDKMSDIDRTAIHEVMEQGRVTIAKAGIQARLNARCSVLAAANPVYGRYDQYKTPMENIGLQDSLLSRFDLLFVMLDLVDGEQDNRISDHVVRMHRYRNPGEQDGAVLPMGSAADLLATNNPDVEEEDDSNAPIYEKYDALLHGNTRSRKDKIISVKFMRKYIHIAKMMKPTLTEEASNVICEEYSKLRSQDSVENDVARTQPVTARTLETLIRLSTAHAKARLSRTVDVEDAQAAIELVQFAYFKKVLEKEKKRRRQSEDGDASADESSDDRPKKKTRKEKSKRPTPKSGEEGHDVYDDVTDSGEDGEEDESEAVHLTEPGNAEDKSAPPTSSAPKSPSRGATTISDERFKCFKASLAKVFREARTHSLSVARVTEFANSEQSTPYSQEEISAAMDKLSEANHIMVADDLVLLI